MKKIICAALCVLLIFSLAACGNKEEPEFTGVYTAGDETYIFAKDGTCSFADKENKDIATYTVKYDKITLNGGYFTEKATFTLSLDGMNIKGEGTMVTPVEKFFSRVAEGPETVALSQTDRKELCGVFSKLSTWSEDYFIFFKDNTFIWVDNYQHVNEKGRFVLNGNMIDIYFDNPIREFSYTESVSEQHFYYECDDNNLILYRMYSETPDSQAALFGEVFTLTNPSEYGLTVDVNGSAY